MVNLATNATRRVQWAVRVLLAAITGCVLGMNAAAQLRDPNPDWAELTSIAPPAFEVSRKVPLKLDPNVSELSWAFDPKTFSLGSDGVSRLVVIATSASGVINIRYDGIHCAKREIKTYARATPTGAWAMATSAAWQPLNTARSSPYALELARTALCDGLVPRSELREILDLLNKKPTRAAQ